MTKDTKPALSPRIEPGMADENQKMAEVRRLGEELKEARRGMSGREAVYSLNETIMRHATPEDFQRVKDALKPIVQEIIARL